jgi:hypothetical protein
MEEGSRRTDAGASEDKYGRPRPTRAIAARFKVLLMKSREKDEPVVPSDTEYAALAEAARRKLIAARDREEARIKRPASRKTHTSAHTSGSASSIPDPVIPSDEEYAKLAEAAREKLRATNRRASEQEKKRTGGWLHGLNKLLTRKSDRARMRVPESDPVVLSDEEYARLAREKRIELLKAAIVEQARKEALTPWRRPSVGGRIDLPRNARGAMNDSSSDPVIPSNEEYRRLANEAFDGPKNGRLTVRFVTLFGRIVKSPVPYLIVFILLAGVAYVKTGHHILTPLRQLIYPGSVR